MVSIQKNYIDFCQANYTSNGFRPAERNSGKEYNRKIDENDEEGVGNEKEDFDQ
jgi:hypothetical protein